MSLAERLTETDRELDALGAVPADLAERVRPTVRGIALSEIDQELDTLASGVNFVASAARKFVAFVPSAIETPAAGSVAPTSVAPTSVAPTSVAPTSVAPSAVEPDERAAPAFARAPSVFPYANAPMATASEAPPASPFSPTLPSEPPPEVETTVGLGNKRRTLTMSEPPMSQAPPPMEMASDNNADVDPFEGQPAPIPVPQRAPSMWPVAPPSKRPPSRTIRTSAAPPPPLPGNTRSRSMRPSDTPDPFAPLNRASSRPPTAGGLDADELFGPASSAPPSASTQSGGATSPPSKPPEVSAGDDFEMLVDDDVFEIDVEEMDELD